MCVRSRSSRSTSPFSVMIWSSFNAVVYAAWRSWASCSCTWRTVLGPRSQRTLKIDSSASVGRGALVRDMGGSIYENLRSVNENLRSVRLVRGSVAGSAMFMEERIRGHLRKVRDDRGQFQDPAVRPGGSQHGRQFRRPGRGHQGMARPRERRAPENAFL